MSQYVPSSHLDELIALGIQSGFGDRFLRIQGVKYFADGALGSQTALMFQPYKGTKSNYGLAVYDEEELQAEVKRCAKSGLNVAIHAIGDRANNMALDAIIKAQGRSAKKFRNRVEHCQLLRKEDIERFGPHGIVGSVQPVQMPLDIDMIQKYWGKRGRFSYAFKSLLKSAASLAFGSDAPIEPPNPLLNIYLAVNRKPQEAERTFFPSEKISVQEAVFAHTYGGAYSVEQEKSFGSIKIGNYADIVILDKDLHCITPDQIPNVEVLGTLLEGEFVYGKEYFQDW